MSPGLSAAEPDYWFLATLMFAILANVSDSIMATILGGVTALLTVLLLLFRTAPTAIEYYHESENSGSG